MSYFIQPGNLLNVIIATMQVKNETKKKSIKSLKKKYKNFNVELNVFFFFIVFCFPKHSQQNERNFSLKKYQELQNI